MPYQNLPSWFVSILPRKFPLDGVLQGFDPNSPIPVNWRKVVYRVFDMPLKNMTFEKRLQHLKGKLARNKNMQVHEFELIGDIRNEFASVNQKYTEIVQKGGKGLMLIKADSNYEGKEVDHLYTYKKEFDGKAEIIGLVEGQQRYYTFLGKYKCKTENGKIFYCGTDIPDDVRKKYHFERTHCKYIQKDVPKIGDTLLYASFQMIKDGTCPREARYKGYEPKETPTKAGKENTG